MDDKATLFEKTSVPEAVMQLAVPTILSLLVMAIYNLADTYFVGVMDNPVQNATVASAAPVLLALNTVNNLFDVESSNMTSRALGRRDYESIRRSSAFGFYCALFFGLFFPVLCTVGLNPSSTLLGVDANTMDATVGYLKWTVLFGTAPAILDMVMAYMVRAEGSSLHTSTGTMSGCLLNIILDPISILLWRFDTGAVEAGLAAFLSDCVACVYFSVLLRARRKTTFVCINPEKSLLQKYIMLGVCAVGIPTAIQSLPNVIGMIILNNFTSSYGAQAMATMGITQKINMVSLWVTMGFFQGIIPLISYNYASGNHRRMEETIFFTVKTLLPSLVAVSLGYLAEAGLLTRVFMDNEAIVACGTRLLRGSCLGLPFLCMDFLAVGVLQAVGMGKTTLSFAILRKIMLEILVLYLLNLLFPLYGLSYVQLVAELVLSTVSVTMLARIFKRMQREDGALREGAEGGSNSYGK